ncbi:unnamed protein product [Meganyctiphanes norvegica]|uniref:Alpha 1,4-glycosyltransferase domain-containing protein n=1 Tax=Meganyctiphanes norvegica TaxID=48144 RepID=A0AAV2QG83_MEGNR
MRVHRRMLGVVALALTATVIMYNALTTLYTNHTKYPGRQRSGYQRPPTITSEPKLGKAPHKMLRSIRTETDGNKKNTGIIHNAAKDDKKSNGFVINSNVKDLLMKDRQNNKRNDGLQYVLLKRKIKSKSPINSVNLPLNLYKPSKVKYVNEKYKTKRYADSQNSTSDNDKESDQLRSWWRTHLCKPSPAPWRYTDAESEPLTLNRDISYLETTEKNIFLLETSCAKVLGPRIWCAVESLAHKHPDHQVTLFLTSPTLMDVPGKSYLRADGQWHLLPDNVHLVYVDLEDMFIGSVLEKVYLSGSWYDIPDLTVLNVSDMLRVLLVHKYGGIYLDLDIIDIKPLDDLNNFVGSQGDLIANGVFGFKKGHWFNRKILNKISTNFMAGPRGHNGPEVFTKAVLEECGDKALRNHKQTAACNGLNIIAPAAFYPVPYKRWELFFIPRKGSTFLKSWSKAYLLHFWNEFSSKTKVRLGTGSAYDMLASMHCPRLYREVLHSTQIL